MSKLIEFTGEMIFIPSAPNSGAVVFPYDLKETFDKFSYTCQKEYVTWIEDAKRPENREARIEKSEGMIRSGKKEPK